VSDAREPDTLRGWLATMAHEPEPCSDDMCDSNCYHTQCGHPSNFCHRCQGDALVERDESELFQLGEALARSMGHSLNCTFKVACICGAAQNQPAALGDWERYKRMRRAAPPKGRAT